MRATAAGMALAAALAGELVQFEQDNLAIESAGGTYEFAVEVAETAEQRAQGLMFRQRLAPDAGMLFLYPAEGRLSMWMMNTFLPLDMLFVAADGRIVDIAQRTVPLSTVSIVSEAKALAVLELNAGTAARLGLAPGDRVRHPAFER